MKYKLIALMFCMLFLIGFVSADWNDRKVYDQETDTITIENWWGLGKVNANYTLTENTYGCSNNCYAEGTVYLDDPNILIQSTRFKDSKGIKKTKEYEWFIKESLIKNKEIPIFTEVCSNSNGTLYCSQEITSYENKEEITYNWKKYKGEELQAGYYNWRLEGKKNYGENIDWVMSSFGFDFQEWAWWNGTGGVQTFDGNYSINTFTSDGTFTWNGTQGNLTVLLIGGGGGGGGTQGGGGGAGGYYYNTSVSITEGFYIVDIGTGGNGGSANAGTKGANTTFNSLVAEGGGSGGSTFVRTSGEDGGAGGGAGTTAGGGTAGIGSQGGDGFTSVANVNGGGGGGAGASATDYDGANGISNSINGTAFYYAGGGGGGNAQNSVITSTGGLGGGGAGGHNAVGTAGTANTGGGGGGGGNDAAQSWTGAAGGSGVVVIRYLTSTPIADPIITLDSPINEFNTTNQIITFNATVSDAVKIDNVTLYINGVLNETNSSGINNSVYTFIKYFENGKYNYSYHAWNNQSKETISATRNFTTDNTPPIITNVLPINNSVVLTTVSNYNVSLNASITDNINLESCWYGDGTTNTTLTCGNNATILLGEGYHTYTWYANDTLGNNQSNYTTFFINYIRENVTSEASVIEGENTTIYFNLTATNSSNLSGNLSYNGTNYIMSEVSNNGTYALLSREIIVPLVDATTSVNLSVNYLLGGTARSTANNTQLINAIPQLIVSGGCSDVAIHFSLFDEGNLTAINGTFDYNFIYGTGTNSSFSRVYGTLTNLHNFYVCINSTISNNWTLGTGEIFYTSTSYVDRRYYLFEGLTLSNNTNNITLYDLISSDQTSFKLEVEDTSLNPYEDKFTTLVRWYPELNEYNVVDMGLTDETGSTVIHVRTEDVDYRIGVYEKNGSLIKLADPIRMVCLVSPCTYTLKVSPTDTDFTSFLNVDYTLTYNRTSGIWTYTFSDASQATSEMNLTIYKLTGTSVYPVCSSSITAYTGAITCDTSIYSGILKAIVKRSASPPVTIAEKIVTVAISAFSSDWGLWLSFLIALPIIFIFAFMTPLGAVIGGVISLIPALYFGVINWAVLGGITVLAGIVLHFLRRT